MWRGAVLCMLMLAAGALPALALDRPGPPKTLNTIADIGKALRACWRWPPKDQIQPGMEFTILLSFKKSGEVFGARITYQSPHVSDEEKAVYYSAMLAALSRCSPMQFSDSLGAAIAGRPLRFHIHDTRQQRKA